MSDESQQHSAAEIGPAALANAAHKFVRFLFGLPGLAFGFGLLSFAIGIGLTDLAADAFWPRHNNAEWIRLAGGISALVVFVSVIKWHSRWTWPQILAVIVLFPVVELLLALAACWMLGPEPDPLLLLCIVLSPALALGGAAWMLRRRAS